MALWKGKESFIGPGLLMLIAFVLWQTEGCREPGSPPQPFVATVNGEKIHLKEFQQRFRQETLFIKGLSALKPAERDRLKDEILDRMIKEKIILQRAREMSLKVTNEEIRKEIEDIKNDYGVGAFSKVLAHENIDYEKWRTELGKRILIEKVTDQEVYAKISVSPEEIKKAYESYRKNFVPEKKVHLAQIVVRDRDKAEALMGRLKKGEDFGKVARQSSIGPEAVSGGDLGFITKGVMPESADAVIFSLTVGGISRIVKSSYGYHIYKILGRDEGGVKRLSEIKEALIADLKRQRGEEAYLRWIEKLKLKAIVRINRAIQF